MADVIRVLYVDDESVLLEMGKEFLEQRGEFFVDLVLSAPEALDILNKKNYDAIVSDYKMPEMDGIEFLKRVRATDKTIPFIIFTGRGREEVVIEALNNGANFYIQKGGDPEALYQELMHVIRQAVTMRRTLMTLAEQEQRYHDIQNANDLIQSVAPDGHFLFVNKKWQDTLGYSETDLPNLTIFDIIHEESLEHCMEMFKRVLSGENVGIIDATFKTRNGMKVYIEGITDCKIVEGQPQYTRGIFKDVTDRKKVDAALKESEERYRNVVEDQTEFISRFRPDGTYVFVNEAYCRYINKTREEIVGTRYIQNIPKEDQAGVTRHLASLTREHPIATFSNRVIMEDGSIRWHQWSNRAIFDNNGIVVEYQSVGRDITDLKEAEHALLVKNEEINTAFEELTSTEEELRQNYELISKKEQALRESEEKYRFLAEATDDVIYIIDIQGKVTHISPRITRYGYNPEEIISRNFTEFIAKEDVPNVLADFQKTVSTRQSTVTTLRVRDKAGNLHWMEDNGALVFDKSGSVVAISGILRDISGRKKVEESLKESEEAFRAMVEQSGEGIIITNFLGILHFANRRALDIIEYPPDKEMPEKFNVLEIVSLESRVKAVYDLLQVSRGIDSYEVNYKIITLDKKDKWIECMGKKITYKGSPAMLLSFREITERRKTDIVLKESEEKLRTIFENSPYPISINSIPDGKFIAINPAFLHSSGYSESEILGKTPLELGLLSLLDYGRLTSHLLLSGKLEHVPMVLMGKGGKPVHVQFSTLPVTINGRPAIMTMTAEITKLKRVEEQLQQKNEELVAAQEKLTATVEELRQNYDELRINEQSLQESEEKFRVLVEHSIDGILITDFSGNLLFANRSAGLIVDVPDYQTKIGKINVMEFVAPESKADVLSGFSKIAQSNDSFRVHFKLVTETQREIWVECVGKKILFRLSDALLISMRDVTEKRRTDETLRESENKFATVFRSSPVALTLVSASSGIFVDVNDAFLKNTGYGPDEVIGKTSEQLGIFADGDEQKQMISSICEQRSVHDIEIKCRIKTGEIRNCLFSSSLIHMGGKHYVLSTIEDITVRKATEYAFQTMVKSMVETTGLNSLQKITENVSSWLGADCVMVGEILPEGKTVRVLSMILDGKNIPDFSYTLKGTPCDNVAEKGFCLYSDNIITLFPESKDLVELNIRGYIGTPLQNSAGQAIGILCALFRSPVNSPPAVQEIMKIIAVKAAAEIERMQMMSALHESEERFRLLLQHVPSVAVQGYHMDGTTHYWNEASEKLYGYTVDEAVGENLVDLIIPLEMREDVRKAMAYMAQTGQPIPSSELSLMKKDGSRVAVYSSHAVVKRSTGEMEFFCIDIDLTELKRASEVIHNVNEQLIAEIAARTTAEGEIIRSLKEKDLLLREIHHRVKNNLQIISSLLNLQSRYITDPKVLESIKDSQSRVRAMALVHERIYRSPNIAEINLKDYLIYLTKQIISFYNTQPNLMDVMVTMDDIMTDIDTVIPIGLIMNELVSNSLKHAFPDGSKGTASIECIPEGADMLRCVYHDNGIGLPAGFDWKNSETLGLRLVNNLVGQLNGTIDIGSGEGTTFIITIQHKRDPAPS